MTKKELIKIWWKYYPVLGALFFIVLLLLTRQFSGLVSFEITLAAVLFYVGLAYFRHWRDKTLTWEVIIEYILLGLLILVILQSYLL